LLPRARVDPRQTVRNGALKQDVTGCYRFSGWWSVSQCIGLYSKATGTAINNKKRRLLVFPFLQSSSYSKVPLATGPVHDGAPKSPGQLVDNDGSSSDHDEVGSMDGSCLVGVRLLVSS